MFCPYVSVNLFKCISFSFLRDFLSQIFSKGRFSQIMFSQNVLLKYNYDEKFSRIMWSLYIIILNLAFINKFTEENVVCKNM